MDEKKGMSKMFNFKMNKNKKINRKKSGIHSFPAMIIVLMMLFGFLFMLTIFAKMAVINREEIRKEAEAGNELIRIYIYIDEEYITSTATTTFTTTSGTATQTITTTAPILSKAEKTRITITNQWGKTSVIDYFVVEAWNGEIISKGDLNIVLGAGEEREFKGNDILSTFGLNDPNYANDFWFFKNHVRCILLHTKLGNTFGSAYKPVRPITQTAYNYIYSFSLTTINQTLTTTYYGSYTLIIQSQISYLDCVDPVNNVWRWEGPYTNLADHYVRSYTYGWTKNLMNDIINPNSDPYGRKYVDGSYNYPAGILLTISHSLPWSCSGDGRVYQKIESKIMDYDGGLGINIVRMELWELDQFGNEVRKILETTSNSITFAMFGNYKLKRFFEGRDKGQVSNPPTTTQTYTITTTMVPTTYRKYIDVSFLIQNGIYQTGYITIYPITSLYIDYDYSELREGGSYLEKWQVVKDTRQSNPYKLVVYYEVRFKSNSPPDAYCVIRIYYHEWNP